MFVKSIIKTNKVTGERKEHFRLCESYRSDNTTKHHTTIIHLGLLPELPEPKQRQSLARRIEQLVNNEREGKELFTPVDNIIEQLAQKFYLAIKEQQRLDIAAGKDYHIVDVNSVKNKQIREAGAEWLCLQAIRQLGIDGFLKDNEWDNDLINLALTHIVSRASYPASELRTSKWIRENSAVCELTGYPADKITKDRLYQISHQLYETKDALEKFLSKRTNELFDLNGMPGYSGDGRPATDAQMALQVVCSAVDDAGNLYLADYTNNRIRRIAFNTVGINNVHSSQNNITLYPNPASNTITLTSAESLPNAAVEISNVLGRVVFKKTYNNFLQTDIDVGSFVSAVYFLKVNGVYAGRFVKE